MPSILFVHGAGHAAWCWHEHFTPWFEARGYTVAAPDLPHHGGRDRRGLKATPLSAYVGAVAGAAQAAVAGQVGGGHGVAAGLEPGREVLVPAPGGMAGAVDEQDRGHVRTPPGAGQW